MSVSNSNAKNKRTAEGMPLLEKAAILRTRRGSIAAIARQLGVSHTTISLVLDGKLPMSDQALRRYHRAIDRAVTGILKQGNQIDAGTRSLQRVDNTARKPVARFWVPREIKESVVRLVLDHGRSVREVQLRTAWGGRKLTERQVLDIVLEHLADRQERAVRVAAMGRGPQGPDPATRAA